MKYHLISFLNPFRCFFSHETKNLPFQSSQYLSHMFQLSFAAVISANLISASGGKVLIFLILRILSHIHPGNTWECKKMESFNKTVIQNKTRTYDGNRWNTWLSQPVFCSNECLNNATQDTFLLHKSTLTSVFLLLESEYFELRSMLSPPTAFFPSSPHCESIVVFESQLCPETMQNCAFQSQAT
jgi:hypothetical protein